MAESGVDVIQAFLDAAANPKLPPRIGSWLPPSEETLFYAAARNAARALVEEWLKYGEHLGECPMAWLTIPPGRECTCGWSSRRAQLEAALSKMEAMK